jgi:hypothetical protein
MTHNATLNWSTGDALVGCLEGISSPDASPKSENEDAIAELFW